MSVSSLPEWKQLLLEKKRREEEERDRREKEEEEKFANMPAWKRGIIQRRKAKQESFGDREKEREVCLLQVDVRSLSDALSDTDSSVTVNLGSELSLSPDPGKWLDADPEPESQVFMETIVPVHENPFMRTQSARRKGRDADVGYQERANEAEVKERDVEKSTARGPDGESGRGRDIELKIGRFRDLSEGRDKERSRDRSLGRERDNNREVWDKDKGQWKEAREKEYLKVRKDEEEKDTDPASSFSPLAPCLRTIRADNIIIIEQDRKCIDERRGKWREVERPEEDLQGKRGMKMDLREILAGGGSVTEIRASDVLIIKPSSAEERHSGGGGAAGGKGSGREDGEMKCIMDGRRDSMGRELRPDMPRLREKENAKEKEKENRKHSLDDNVFVEKGGRVSQLLSKFGERRQPPSRSKSSDNFLRPVRRKYSGDHDDQQSEGRNADGRNVVLKGVPKRSFSFSDRVICAKENGLNEGYYERKTREIRHVDKDMSGKHKDGHGKSEDDRTPMQRRREEDKRVYPVDRRAAEQAGDADGDEGFTVASVKNTEGISFARRLPIRQDGKPRAAERDVKRLAGARSLSHCDKKVSDFQREEAFESTIPDEAMQNYVTEAAESASSCHSAESHYRHKSGFTECSSLLSTVADRGAEVIGPGQAGPFLTCSGLSQHTEDLISKIEKIGETIAYSNEKGERASRPACEVIKESKQEVYSERPIQDVTSGSPKRVAPMEDPPSPLEVQIPTTVFYVAEEVEKKKAVGHSNEGQDSEGGQGVERRDSWRIGKPLSRIESLREKIRKREQERLRQREAQGGDDRGVSDTQLAWDQSEEMVAEKEWEASAHVQQRSVEQEDAAAQTSVTAFDVTEEVAELKTCLQFPVSVLYPQAVRGDEVTSGFNTTVSEAICEGFQISKDDDDHLEHLGEQLRHRRSPQGCGERETEEDEKELSEDEDEDYTSLPDPSQTLSPSPPHPGSLAAMSRIYNLETVGSRSGLCLRERNVDVSPVQLVKVKPLVSNSPQGESKVLSAEDICVVQKVQRQIEQFQLKEQEVVHSQHVASSSPSREAKGQVRLLKHQLKEDVKIQDIDQETSEIYPKAAPRRICSPTAQLKQSIQTISLIPSLIRSQSPDKSRKLSDSAPTPASSPCSPSPAQSPAVSPSPTRSQTNFSIRSASGGQVKRGATITITPKKQVGGGGRVTGATPAGSATVKMPQITAIVTEPTKKKYPSVDEIEVIGGYLNLERSCLLKSKRTPKRVSGKFFTQRTGKL